MSCLRTGVLAALLGLSPSAPAQEGPSKYKLDIPRQTLGTALREFARDTGFEVVRFSELNDRTIFSSPVVGYLTAPEALEALLTGTGLGYRAINSRAFAIIRIEAPTSAPPQTVEPSPRGTSPLVKLIARIGAALGVCIAGVAAPGVACADDLPQPAAANNDTLQEIVVTAEKRSSTVQSTPISITAVSGADLLARGITDLTTLATATPGVSLKNNGPGQTELEMRGMTSSGGNSPTVGFYLDDVPMTAPAAAQNGKVVIDPGLYDLSRIEVLRGPQGTLYGSGSMGGTVRLITNQPDLTGFHASAQSILSDTDGGGFNHNVNAMVNLPIGETMAVRIVGSEAHTSGWIDRIVVNPFPLPTDGGATRGNVLAAPVESVTHGSNAAALYSTRVTFLWKPTDDLSITPSFFHQRTTQDGTSTFDSNPGTLARYQPFNIPEPYADKIDVGSLNATYKFQSFEATSITTYWKRTSRETQDGSEDFNNPIQGVEINAPQTIGLYLPDGTGPVSGTEVDTSRQFSEEIRAASNGDGRLNWLGGFFMSRFRSSYDLTAVIQDPSAFVDLGTLAPATSPVVWNLTNPTDIKQYALFGEVGYALTDHLKATVGIRGFSYKVDFSQYFAGFLSPLGAAAPVNNHVTQSQTSSTPKLNLSYEFDKDLMVYGTIAKGFRPGGGNEPLPTNGPLWANLPLNVFKYPTNQWPQTYSPDSVWNYEIGEKARFLDRRITLNSSLYYERWNNIQLEELPNDYPLTDNNGTATIWGGEVELQAILGAGFHLGLVGGYTHASLAPSIHYTIVPNDKLSDVPPYTGDINLTYTTPISPKYELEARIESNFVGRRYSLTFPPGYSTGALTELPSYGITNMRAGILSGDGWEATVFANNVFNKQASLEYLTQLTLANPSFSRVVTNQPLTVGVDLSFKF